jgi:predicted dienelactone hydrolase
MTIMPNRRLFLVACRGAARLMLASLLMASGASAAPAGEGSARIAGLAVTIWSPDPPQRAALPVVIFSHGFHGCATQSRFLMRAFADAGYLVFAPNHRDATCDGGSARWLDRPAVPFARPDLWSASSFRDRADDIVHLLAALRADRDWSQRIDWRRVALAGHSLGGYTVLGLAGAWPEWRLPDVKAVLALSPYTQPFVVRHDLSGLAAPVMYQGGTRDFGITPALEKTEGAYALSPPPKYFVEFAGAAHLAWADIGVRAHSAIAAYSVAFLDRCVNGGAPAPLLTQPGPDVARLLFDPGIASMPTPR